VDYFEPVAVFEDGLGPGATGGNFAIEFDGDPILLHVERFDQGREGKWGRGRIRDGMGFSIDV
jgi:hypothetical protein